MGLVDETRLGLDKVARGRRSLHLQWLVERQHTVDV